MAARITASLLAAALALTGTEAQAQDRSSANYVLPHCRAYIAPENTSNLYEQGHCIGMIQGILFMSRDDDRKILCTNAPKAATGWQAARVVVAYIEARPERMHEPFMLLAFQALQAAWPCK